MSIPTLPAPPDTATVDALATALNRCFETFTADVDIFTADAFFDLLPPFWRFQLQGRTRFLAQLRTIARGPSTARILRVSRPCPDSSWSTRRPRRDAVARRLLLCEVRDGRITDVRRLLQRGMGRRAACPPCRRGAHAAPRPAGAQS